MIFDDKSLKQVEKSATLLLNEQSRNLEAQGKGIYKLGFGQSPFSPPDFVIEELADNASQHYYAPVQGLLRLREAVAKFHSLADGLDISADDVFIAPGSKILIYAVMQCFDKANVLIPTPAWVSYKPQAGLCSHNIYRIPTEFKNRWRVTTDDLKEATSNIEDENLPKLMILNYPGNPDGITYSQAELQEIAQFCRDNRILVISDEIYGLLHHKGRHISLAKFYPEGTIITTGLSKWCGAGGWRLGVAILPKNISTQFKETLLGVASETYSCEATPVQLAAIKAYQAKPEIWDYIKHQRRILSAVGNESYNILDQAGIDVHKPEGGFYLFLDFSPFKEKLNSSGILSSADLCSKILDETGVAILPANAFGFEDRYMAARISYTDFDGNKALQQSREIALENELPEDFAGKNAVKVVKAVQKISQWISKYN